MVGVGLKNTTVTLPSKFLDVLVITSNRAVLKYAAESFMIKRNIIRNSFGLNATMKLAAINMDKMGYIKSHSGIVNLSKRLMKMRNQMQMLRSFSEMYYIETNVTVDKKYFYTDSLIFIAPSVRIKMSSKSGDVMNLTKK